MNKTRRSFKTEMPFFLCLVRSALPLLLQFLCTRERIAFTLNMEQKERDALDFAAFPRMSMKRDREHCISLSHA